MFDIPEIRGHGVLRQLTSQELLLLMRGISLAVSLSFQVDQQRVGPGRSIVRTQHEVRRRVALCVQAFADLAADQGWGIKRTIDHLPLVLRKRIDTVDFKTDNRKVWCPGDLIVTPGS